MSESREIRIKRLLYQSWYRGCKETDRLLGYFAKDHLHELAEKELDDFEAFMDEDDRLIFLWLTGKEPLPEKYQDSSAIQKILSYNFANNYA